MANTMRRINRNGVMPLYRQLEDILFERIERGEFKPGDQFPTEDALIKQYNVSRITVRQALRELVDRGVLVRQPGRGSFVQQPKVDYSLTELTSFTEQMEMLGKHPSSEVLKLQTEQASREVREQLDLTEGSCVLRIERLRLADGQPMALETIYLPEDLAPGLEAEDLAHQSVYRLLELVYNLRIADADLVLEARSADEDEAEALGIPPDAPVLFMRCTTYLPNGRPLNYVHCTYRGDTYRFHSTMIRRHTINKRR